MSGCKLNGCNKLAVVGAAKFGQAKGLSLNLGKQKGYGINAKPPAVCRGLFLDSYFKYSGLGESNTPSVSS